MSILAVSWITIESESQRIVDPIVEDVGDGAFEGLDRRGEGPHAVDHRPAGLLGQFLVGEESLDVEIKTTSFANLIIAVLDPPVSGQLRARTHLRAHIQCAAALAQPE